ncbi:MAG TPA: hypothetical protein VM165_14625 [Planctomycetaceae bacterium]|nr:hypothetical protein [Planctomycetaceae bacterium]
MMTTSITRLTKPLRPARSPSHGTASGGPAKAGRWSAGVALCTLVLLAAAPAAVQAQGSLLSWGSHTQIYFPDGITSDVGDPVSDTPAGTFIAVAGGFSHSHAIRTDGTLVSWGTDLLDYHVGPGGLLEDVTFTGQISDTPAGTFTAVAAGLFHSVAIRTDGTLASWGGLDEFGEVSDTPAGTFIAVAEGYDHSTAIRTDGSLVDWGREIESEFSLRPTTGTFIAVAAGWEYSVALRSDGTLIAWGDHTYVDPMLLNPPAGTFIAVSASASNAVAIRTDGTLSSWGNDSTSQVSDTPAGTYVAVAVGSGHCVALRTDGRLVSWGQNFAGVVSDTPTGYFTAVAAGGYHSVAIRRPLTVLEGILDLSLTVQAFVEDGAPLPSKGQSLQVKLDAAAAAVEVNATETAVGSLGAFINQTGAFVKTKKLTPAQGQTLIDGAGLIITDLGG